MKSEPIEDRLKDALESHAETFTASPDAWQRMAARAPRPAGGQTGWLARHTAFVIPAAAAATVVAVALSAMALAHGLSGTGRAGGQTAPAGTASHPAGQDGPPNPDSRMLATDPPVSAIFTLKVAPGTTEWNWIGQPSSRYWFPYPATSPEFCHWVSYSGGGSGSCWPLPAVNQDHPAMVISDGPTPVITGLAEPAVRSVTAVLRDGQRFRAAIGTASGFAGLKAWSVHSPAAGTKLVFTGANGQLITTLSTAAPAGPIVLDIPRPSHGGAPMFSYPASSQVTAGSVTAYLIDGHVAFFWPPVNFGGKFSPYAASAAPAVDGMATPFGAACTPDCHGTDIKAFGYAHGDVARVVVRLPGGGQVATDAYPAGWAGSGLRLWQVTLPDSVWPQDGAQPKLIATAYDAAGHAIGQAQLGQPDY